jgi:hypothetical protein
MANEAWTPDDITVEKGDMGAASVETAASTPSAASGGNSLGER